MRERSDDYAVRPCRRDWLPDPQPPERASEWDAKVERIMAATDPELRRLRSRRAAAVARGWSAIGRLWKPAAALAAAAAALLLGTAPPAAPPEPPPTSLSLSLIASEGDPVTLWEAFWAASGIQADPVLALIAFQGQVDVTGQGVAPAIPGRESR